MAQTNGPTIFYRSGSTLYRKGGGKTNYQELNQLYLSGNDFVVIRKSDGRDITTQVLEDIDKKLWTEDEIETLINFYGKLTLAELHKKYLPKKSTGQIRYQASQLSLTVDKSWQDHEIETLSILRRSGISFPLIGKILERPIHAVQVKAKRMGLVSHGHANASLENVQERMANFSKMPSLTKGKVSEDIASIELVKKNFDVWVPYTPQHYTDLIVVKGKSVAKIQVKTAVFDSETNRFRVPLRRKISVGKKKGERPFYDDDDVDFFMLVCLGIEAIYFVPFQLCKEYGFANLYPHRPKQIHIGFDWEPYRENFQLLNDFLN